MITCDGPVLRRLRWSALSGEALLAIQGIENMSWSMNLEIRPAWLGSRVFRSRLGLSAYFQEEVGGL